MTSDATHFALGQMVKRLQIRHHRAADAALAGLGITLVQWDALRHMHQSPGASQHELARLTFQTDQSFGTLAARMEARGFIERVPGPGRAVRHRITPEGERLRVAGGALLLEVIERSFAPLSEEQRETLGELLRLVLGADAPA